ncbi:hypothetical protein [Thiohalorhabdus sp.]|uniref:hypothetical protein n=1 Tax=Thiohalorhabdus sp. TaxID=3094134 RepID=UPI002FC2E92A
MDQAPVRDFAHLLARLQGLAEGAAQGGSDPMVAHLQNLQRRVWAIHDHLMPAAPIEKPPAPETSPPLGPTETVAAFLALVDAAEEAGIHFTLVDFLRNAGHRLDKVQRGTPDKHLAPRHPEEGEARLEHGSTSHTVWVAESSSFGLGVEIDTLLAPDQVVRLVVTEAYGATTYECLRPHTRPKGDAYHLGLKIFAVRI